MMSLYRRHQRLSKLEEWSNAARFSLPVALTMNLAGCTSVADGGWSVMAVSAAVSVVGWWAHKKASAALTKFIAKVAASKWLRARYDRDARIGRNEDQIAQLEQEQTAALMAAALAAKNGHVVTAGLFYGLAKRAEGRLRRRGQ